MVVEGEIFCEMVAEGEEWEEEELGCISSRRT